MNARPNEMGNAESIRVLVVEDNPFDQELLQRQLRKTSVGDKVLFLSDPRAALDWMQGLEGVKLRKELVAIFLDVHLPHMTGIELLRIIRLMEGMQDLPVMVMTAFPHPDTVAACQELKVRAFVEKPISFQDFSRVIAPLFHQAPPPKFEPTAVREPVAPMRNGHAPNGNGAGDRKTRHSSPAGLQVNHNFLAQVFSVFKTGQIVTLFPMQFNYGHDRR